MLGLFVANDGVVTQRQAALDIDMASASLAVTIFRLRGKGFNIDVDRRVNPLTKGRYTAYKLVSKG